MDPETARVGVEFIYNIRYHIPDLLFVTIWALSVYTTYLWIKNKFDK